MRRKEGRIMRALTPWRPLRQLSSLHDEIDRMFTEFFGPDDRWLVRPFETTFVPAVESFVKDDKLVVRADLPGIDPKDVELAVEGDRLSIRGERKEVKEEKDQEYFHREVTAGRFERILVLPGSVDRESVKATYHDGVLEVTMSAPKGMVQKKVPIEVK
jgi:HSP20 family protein